MNPTRLSALSVLLIASTSLASSSAHPAKAAAKHPAQPASPNYSSCSQYDDFDTAFMNNDPKAIATGVLNGALFRIDDQISAQEIAARDWCVSQALARGADPNNKSGPSAPLIIAVGNDDTPAALALLKYKADPNAVDTGLGLSSQAVRVLTTACSKGDDAVILALLAAGADPVKQEPLWTAAANGDDVAVQALLNTGKIPLNQISTFGDDSLGESETALDASEQRLDAIKTYFSQTQGKSASDKREYVNLTLLYGYYVSTPMIADSVDPDGFVQKIQTKQQHVSDLLKAKGWTCHEDNCGIDPDLSGDGSTDDSSLDLSSSSDSQN